METCPSPFEPAHDIKRRIATQQDNEWWESLGYSIDNLSKDNLIKEVMSLLKEWNWLDE